MSFITKDFLKSRLITPKYKLTWTILLLNKKKIKVTVNPDIKWEWDFALSYQQHDFGLCVVEQLLNNNYPLEYHYLDIGANMGLRSIYALSMKRKTILFEPNIGLKPFKENLFELNDFKNYQINTICLSDDNSNSLPFYISNIPYLSSFDQNMANKGGGSYEIDIPVISLDSYCEKHLEVKPGIIKIDVEGSELKVIKGAIKTIKKFNPSFLIELLDKSNDCVAVVTTLLQEEYEVFELKNKLNNNVNKLTLEEFYQSKSTNFLFYHSSMPKFNFYTL